MPRVTDPPRTGTSWTRVSRGAARPAASRIEVRAAPSRIDRSVAGDATRGRGDGSARIAAAAAASSAASMSSSVCWTGRSRGVASVGDATGVRAVSPARPAEAACAASAALAASAAAASPAPSGGGAALPSSAPPVPRDASYSPTEANTGRPADAASARAAASLATIERRFSWVRASRASSRKLIREVATREPCGRTTATRRPSTERIRAAADVISSSMSR